MYSCLFKKSKHILATLILLFVIQNTWAAGPLTSSIFNNTLALTLLLLMALLLIVIGILGNILIGVADIKMKRSREEKKNSSTATSTAGTILLLLLGNSAFGQDHNEPVKILPQSIGGMEPWVFYLMITIIFLELLIVMVLLVNVRFLMKKEKASLEITPAYEIAEIKKTRLSWWDRFNKLRPVSQEADLDLGHEYDGIRELNNRLPPWWLYGFYASILFAVIYLWRFHVSHTGPSSKEEYEYSVAKAEFKIREHLKAKGDAVDENSVTLLTAKDDLDEGRLIFIKSCASCHQESGAGNIGPNLTDDFWMHGNDVKSIFKTIRYGVNAMPQWQNSYSNKEIAQVTSYIKSLKGSNPANAKEPQGIKMIEEIPTKSPVDTVKNKIASLSNQ